MIIAFVKFVMQLGNSFLMEHDITLKRMDETRKEFEEVVQKMINTQYQISLMRADIIMMYKDLCETLIPPLIDALDDDDPEKSEDKAIVKKTYNNAVKQLNAMVIEHDDLTKMYDELFIKSEEIKNRMTI